LHTIDANYRAPGVSANDVRMSWSVWCKTITYIMFHTQYPVWEKDSFWGEDSRAIQLDYVI